MKCDHLNLFISMLQDVDFAATKYYDSALAPQPGEGDADFFSDKTNLVCAALRKTMIDNSDAYLLPVLSTFAKQKVRASAPSLLSVNSSANFSPNLIYSQPPQLSKALTLIKSQAKNKGEKLTSGYAQDAFKYLAFLARYETLYEVSLGLYDFELAKAVARGSQMDPKVYLREIKDLEEMEIGRARYTVDVKLQRWDSAARNLRGVGDVEKCLKLIEDKNLLALGLELFGEGPERDEVKRVIGRSLIREGKGAAAVSVYLSVGDVKEAVATARIYGDWKTVVTYFADAGAGWEDDEGEGEELIDVIEEMVEQLSGEGGDKGRMGKKDAARVLVEYGRGEERLSQAVRLLCDGGWWTEAELLVGRHGESLEVRQTEAKKAASEELFTALISVCVGVGESKCAVSSISSQLAPVVEACKNYTRVTANDLDGRAVKFQVQKEKYVKSKQKMEEIKKKREEMGYEEGAAYGGGEGSEYSVATDMSNVSGMSGMSMGSVTSTKSFASGYSGMGTNFHLKTTQHAGKYRASGRELAKIKAREKRNAKRRDKKMQPGSVEEIAYYRGGLIECCVGTLEVQRIEEALQFLIRRGGEMEGLCLRLVESYEFLCKVVSEGEKIEGVGDSHVELSEDVMGILKYLGLG